MDTQNTPDNSIDSDIDNTKPALPARAPNGRWLPGQSANPDRVIRTREQASAIARLRWQKAQQAAAEGMLRGVMRSGVVDIDPRAVPVDAWGALIEHSAEVSMVSNQERGLAELNRFIGHAASMMPLQHERTEEPAPGYARLDVPADMLLELLRQLRAEQAQRVAEPYSGDPPPVELTSSDVAGVSTASED